MFLPPNSFDYIFDTWIFFRKFRQRYIREISVFQIMPLRTIKKMISRRIVREEPERAISNGEVIEEYPDDKYSPTCLIYGKSKSGRHLHVHVSVPPKVVVITTYDPDPAEWDNYRTRR
jgi:hypothetical protein